MNKTNFATTYLILCFLALSCSSPQTEKLNSDNAAIIEMLKTFYSSYIIENSKDSTNEKEIESIKKRYSTARFLDKFNNEEIDADPYLNVQDFKKEWVNTLSVKKAHNSKENSYNVCFNILANEKPHCINVSIVKESNKWKINNVSW
jgi:hypothetical protein